jgi:pimeloyl-ACP methyl ester carboxylesterase
MIKLILFIVSFILVVLLLGHFFIYKLRWSDKKAQRVFITKNVALKIYNTVIDGHCLHYAMTGDDKLPSLVFIHGSPGSWINFRKYMWDAGLLEKFRIISIDRPGFGHSDFGIAMRLQEQCKLIMILLRQLKTGQPMFVSGHSYGGPVVARLAADDPILFKTILIVAGAIDPAQEKKENWRYILEKKPLCWFIPGAFRPSNTELIWLKEDLKTLATDLDKITTDVVFVHGDKDIWVPVENTGYGKKMMVSAASLSINILPGAGHLVGRERMEDLKDILSGLR